MNNMMVGVPNSQMKDQAAKGGIMGIIMYLAYKNDVDPVLMSLSLPVISAVLAFISTKIGDKELASFFD